MTRHSYSAAAHDRALAQLDRAWNAMRSIARRDGRSSDAYRDARQDVLDARRIVRLEARRPRGPLGRVR